MLLLGGGSLGAAACLVSVDGLTGGTRDASVDTSQDSSLVESGQDSSDDTLPVEAGPPPADGGSCVPLDAPSPGTGVACDAGTTMTPDTGADDEAGSCEQASVAGFTPTWHAPRRVVGACTNDQITDFATACIGTASTPTACNAYQQASISNANCEACLVTPATNPQYGALINKGAYLELNLGGCVDLLEPCNQNCGEALLGQIECEGAACSACTFGSQGFEDCNTAADGCGCTAIAEEASNCHSAITQRQSPAAACFAPANFLAGFSALASLFCGGGADGGGAADSGGD